MPGRPGSKRGQVRAAYLDGGEAAAIKKGTALGIKATKVQRWIRKLWSNHKPKTTPLTPKEKKLKNTFGKPGIFDEGDTVVITWNTDLVGRVVKKGPEQTDIKFANGNIIRCMSNRDLARTTRKQTLYEY